MALMCHETCKLQAIPVSLHKIPVSLHVTPVSPMDLDLFFHL